MKVYFLITSVLYVLCIIAVPCLVNGMVLQDGALLHLDNLVQKSIRYRYHKENYVKSLNESIVPTGLKIKKRPALLPVSEDFERKWNSILYDAEKNIIKLLLYEFDQIIAKIEVEIQQS